MKPYTLNSISFLFAKIGEKMTQLQQKLLDIFAWFDALCTENHLCYYAVGGTAIGAVRHNGFIPWDDDIDVALPRADYERLKVLCRQRTGERYEAEWFWGQKDFVFPFIKIYDTQTTLVENVHCKAKRGIYIDVFPLDGLGNTMPEAVRAFRKIDRLKNLLTARVTNVRKGRSGYKNAAIALLKTVPHFLIPEEKLLERLDTVARCIPYETSEIVANTMGSAHLHELMRKEWFGTPVRCQFENLHIGIPQNFHCYLTALYGEYMILPPAEQRRAHHEFLYYDLTRSYKEVF